MDNNKELAELRKQLRKEKAKNGMPLKKKLIYGGAIGGAAVGAAIAIGLSVGEDDYKDHVLFDNGQRFDKAQQVNGKTQRLVDFNMDNKIIAGDQIIKATDSITNWGTNERLVKVDNDEVKAAFDGNPNVYTFYFADTKPSQHKPTPAKANPSLAVAFDSADAPDTPDEKGITHANGEVTTPNLMPSDPKYKGVIPADYDENERRYGNATILNRTVDDFDQNGEILHKVSFDTATGRILSITNPDGSKVAGDKIAKVPEVSSTAEVELMTEDGEITKRKVSYAEAADKMAEVIQQLGDIRGVTSTLGAFDAAIGTDMDIYATNIAGIVDIPSYIHLLVDKKVGNELHFKLNFDKTVFPNLNEDFTVDHEIVLYQQPGGAMKVMDDAMKWFNEHISTQTLSGEWHKSKLLSTTSFQEVDQTDQDKGAINMKDLLALMGTTKDELKWGLRLKQLPSLKLEYRVLDTLYEDGTAQIELRPKFKTYYSKIAPKPINVKVTGITQAIVDEEQQRVNAKKETFDLKVDAEKLDALQGVTLSNALIKLYGLTGAIDPRFTYKISHKEVNSDGDIDMTLEVSKGGITSKVAATPLKLNVHGIDAAKALIKEQDFFNGLAPSLKVDDIKYAATTAKSLTQKELEALGIKHTLDLTKYKYELTNGEITSSGKQPMTIAVKPLAKQNILHPAKAFQMNFQGVTEAQEISKEQKVVNSFSGKKANIDKVNLPEASDKVLTQALADELGLGYSLKSEFKYTYTHKGINGDTDLDVTVQVSKTGNSFIETPTSFKVAVSGIDRAIAIAGQTKEQEEINKLADHTLDVKIDDLQLAANKQVVLRTDADFAKYGLVHKVKPGYAYYLDSDELKADGNSKYTISVMIWDTKINGIDPTIPKATTIKPIPVAVTGINASKALKAEQEKVNGILASGRTATIKIKDLLHATVSDTKDVVFPKYDGTLTQLISDNLNLGLNLNPAFSYHITYTEAKGDGPTTVRILVSDGNVQNRADLSKNTGDVQLTGIQDVIDQLGLDKAQNVVNGLASADKALTVHDVTLAAATDEDLTGDLLTSLGITKASKYTYKVNHVEINSDGKLNVVVSLFLGAEPSTITPAAFTVVVTGIEDTKLEKEQDRVDTASATYDIPDSEFDNLDSTATPLSSKGVAKELTVLDITKYGIKVGGKELVMLPEYDYTFSFGTINADGDADLTIQVNGKSTYDASALKTPTPTPVKLAITGFVRAQAEKDLAIEQERLNNIVSGFTGGVIKAIKLDGASGDLDQAALDAFFTKEDSTDDTKVVPNPADVANLGLNSKYTYTYSHPSITTDGDLPLTITAHLAGVKELKKPESFKFPITGIDAAVVQYINEIILKGITKGQVIDTTVNAVSIPTAEYDKNDPAKKVEPQDEILKQLSLSFDATNIDKILTSLRGKGMDAALDKIKAKIGADGTLVGLSSWIADQQALAGGKDKFHFYYELHKCDASGTVTAGPITEDGYVKFTLHYNVEGQPSDTTDAIINVTGINDEKRRVELATEQTKLNALTPTGMSVSEVSFDQITPESRTELTQALADKFALGITLNKDFIYYISTDRKIEHNEELDVTVSVFDRTNPSLEVHDIDKKVVVPDSFKDAVKGIDEQRAIVTQTDAQNEINALSAAHHNMEVDVLELPAITTPVILSTKADFAKYGLNFDPEKTDAHSKSLGVDFTRKGYTYELTYTGTKADGTIQLTITAMIVQTSGRTAPTIAPIAIDAQVTGIDAAIALKAEQDRVNSECKADSPTFYVDNNEYAATTAEQTLDQVHANAFGLSITLNPNYEYTYEIPTTITASGDMDMIIHVNSKTTGKTQLGTAESFKVAVTGIDEYIALHKALEEIAQAAKASETTPIAYNPAATSIASVAGEELTQDLVDQYHLNIKLDPTTFKYTYTIASDVTADGSFDLTVLIGNAGAIKSAAPAPITFKMKAEGINSAVKVQADLDSIKDTVADLEVTQPELGTVTDGYNTNEYTAGDTLTEDQIISLTKDTLSTTNPDATIFGHDDNSGATWTYKFLSKAGTTLTIEVSATDGNFVTTKDITLNGFINGTDANNFDYPTEEITKDLAAIAGTTHTTAVTLPVSAHIDEPLTQRWIDYLDLGIVLDSRFDYTFSNALTASGDMDVTVKVVRKVNPDPTLAISQVIKVAVTPPATSFDKAYLITSFAHEALSDATSLHGMPDEVIKYIDEITDQFRGFTSKYTMGKIEYGTNITTPLTITLSSIDDPSNTFSFIVYMVIGDQTKAPAGAKTLIDAKDILDLATVSPVAISEPTRSPADVLKNVANTLRGITSATAKINAESFAQIPVGTPLTQALLDELNIDAQIGSAIGLIGDEFTVSSNKELASDGDLLLTITPADGSSSFDITISVTGIDDFKIIRDDLDGLSQIYTVEPRNANKWTTNEYTAWTTKLTDEQLQRLTAHNEWTQAALEEQKDAKEVIMPPKAGIIRHIAIKSKTATELVLEITDVLGDSSYSKEVTLSGFVDDSSAPANNLWYLHQFAKEELDGLSANPIIISNHEGEGVPSVTDAALSQQIVDFFHINLKLNSEIKYTYSIDKPLSESGDVDIKIKETFPSGDSFENTIHVTMNFATHDLFGFFSEIKDGSFASEKDMNQKLVSSIKETLGANLDKTKYVVQNLVITNSAELLGSFTVEFKNVLSGSVTKMSGHFFNDGLEKSIAVPNAATKYLSYVDGQQINVQKLQALLGSANQLPDLPAGYSYSIVVNKAASGDALIKISVMEESIVKGEAEYTLTGLKILDGVHSDATHAYVASSDDLTKPVLKTFAAGVPKFDADDKLINDWWMFKAGDTKEELRASAVLLKTMISEPYQTKNALIVADLKHLSANFDGTPSQLGYPAPNNFRISFKLNGGTPQLVFTNGSINVPITDYTSMAGKWIGDAAKKNQINCLTFLKGGFAAAIQGAYPDFVLIMDDKGAIHFYNKSALPNDIKEMMKTLFVAVGKVSDRSEIKEKDEIVPDSEVQKLVDSGAMTKLGTRDIVDLGITAGNAAASVTAIPSSFKEFPTPTTLETLVRMQASASNTIKLQIDAEITKSAFPDDSDIPLQLALAIGLSPTPDEKLTFSMDPITKNGPMEVKIKLVDADGVSHNFTINLNITGFDEYNAGITSIKDDLNKLADKYDVNPRPGQKWTTSQYSIGDVMDPDTLQRLTALNEWTDPALAETSKEVIKPIVGTIKRVVKVKEKTPTTLVLTFEETDNGITVTKDVTLEGFDPSVSAVDNPLEYLHELIDDEFKTMHSTPIEIKDFVGEGIPKITDAILTQEIADFLNLPFKLNSGIEYHYSTSDAISNDGSTTVTIVANFSKGKEITNTVDLKLSFSHVELTAVFNGAINVSSVDSAGISPENLASIKDSLGTNIDASKYTIKNITITDASNLIGHFEFDMVNTISGSVTHQIGKFINIGLKKDITAPDAAKKLLKFEAGKQVSISDLNSLLGSANQLPTLPTGYSYSAEISKATSGDAVVTLTIMKGSAKLGEIEYNLKGLEAYNGVHTDATHAYVASSDDLTKPALKTFAAGVPKFDADDKLINDWWMFKAGDTKEELRASAVLLKTMISEPYQTKNALIVADLKHLTADFDGTPSQLGYPAPNNFRISFKLNGGTPQLVFTNGSINVPITDYTSMAGKWIGDAAKKNQINCLTFLKGGFAAAIQGAYPDFVLIMDDKGVIHFYNKSALPNDIKEMMKTLFVAVGKVSDRSEIKEKDEIVPDSEVQKLVDSGAMTSLGGKTFSTLGDATTSTASGDPDVLPLTFKEFPVSPAPAADEPDVYDEPTQGIVPQDDYPIDSPSTSFFAWSVNNIYKNN